MKKSQAISGSFGQIGVFGVFGRFGRVGVGPKRAVLLESKMSLKTFSALPYGI